MDFSFEAITQLKRSHPAFRLLAAEHAPLILSFFHAAFVQPNARSLSEAQALQRLDDHLHELREVHGETLYPKSARQYLDDWAAPEHAWLRKLLLPGKDEPEYDLTPESELALEWLASLAPRAFVGTESRLGMLIELLRQVVAQASADPKQRLAILEQRRAEIEAEIETVQSGQVSGLSAVQVRERYFEIRDLARRLLGDFRQVEQNFRLLDRQARQHIAQSQGGRGAVLDEIFGEHDLISDSEQGQSFRAFWRLLMSPDRQHELDALVAEVESLAALSEEDSTETGLQRFRLHLAEAGDRVHRTLANLSAQLRRFLDDQAWLENRRLLEIIQQIERAWIDHEDLHRERQLGTLDAMAPSIHLPLERKLFEPPVQIQVKSDKITVGAAEVDTTALFEQFYVDTERLRQQIRHALRGRSQIDLSELVQRHPLRQGLAELIAYLTLASSGERAVIDPLRNCEIIWQAAKGEHWQRATVPQIIFTA